MQLQQSEMPLIAKTVVKNKFWIVEKDGQKIGTIQKNPDGVVYVHDETREPFPSLKKLTNKYNVIFDSTPAEKKTVVPAAEAEFDVGGYPCPHKPFNVLYDIKKQAHIYTKKSASKSYFCAGYFIIKFSNGWVKAFCPKLITLERYEFRGPYKTKFEMQEQMRVANNEKA